MASTMDPQLADLPIEMAVDNDDDMPELIETDPSKGLPSLIEQNTPKTVDETTEFTQVRVLLLRMQSTHTFEVVAKGLLLHSLRSI
ncbi:unnamed protein product [Anisakis simplex]|uniref:Uncharacterized protein n=1 Tax=Anisakis simplex TaxID=6269 RepID=A0A0M3K9D5_ANISI|nr:unnamed protein product [Anisakis simplex]